jgi:hypothetical protein
MTTPVFSLAPSPKWYFADAQGAPAAGGTMTTYSSIDHSTPMFIFSDPLGTNPYDNPMNLDASGGTKCPMYWDVTNPGAYYVVVADAAGNIICTVDQFPLIGGGGVTPITSLTDIENHLVNGQFLFIDANSEADSVVSTIPEGETHMAPGSGFFKNALGNYQPSLEDGISSGWSFEKEGGVGATDSIQFVAVTALGAGIPTAPTANATRFFQFTCSAIGTGYTKAYWRDVIPNVEMFQGETLTITFDTNATVAAMAPFEFVQHFGTDPIITPTPDIVTPVNFTYSSGAWARQTLTITVPSIVGKIKGSNGDDCIIFRWGMPLNVLGTFQLVNHQAQIGTFGLVPYIEQTYAQDQYKVLIDLIALGNTIFTTGELKIVSNAPGGTPINIPGWVVIQDLNDTIGSAASGALRSGTIYKNLYIAWWNSFNDTECPVTGGRSTSAEADFNNNKGMGIPRHILGAVLAGAGQSLFADRNFGDFEGNPNLSSHAHGIRGISGAFAGSSGAITILDGGGSVVESTELAGDPASANNMQPTFYLWLYVKL